MASITIPEELSVGEIRELGQSISEYFPYCEEQRQFHISRRPYRWLFGGNQSGKTYANMMDLAMVALDVHPVWSPCTRGEGIHWAGIESWEQVRDILWGDYLSHFIPPWAVLDIWKGKDDVPRKVFLKNGHVIEFKAFNQGRSLFQGRAINSFHGDEQCLKRGFQAIFQEIQARLMKHKGIIAWSMTPIVPQIELESRIEKAPKTDEILFMDLNKNRLSLGGHLPDEEVDKLIADWSEEVQITRVGGRFSSFCGAVFKTYMRQRHVVDPFRIPKNWRRYRAFDFGFTNPFVCLWLAKDPDENWYIYREYYKAQTGIADHIRAVKVYSKGERYVKNIADPENAEDRAEMRKAGIVTMAARKDIARGIELMQSKFKVKANGKPSLFIFRNCENTCREVAVYHYPQGRSTSNPADIPVQKDDHTVDAARYGLYTVDGKFKRGRVCAA
jgi:hypothetical protein